jgi:hypothetical protein
MPDRVHDVRETLLAAHVRAACKHDVRLWAIVLLAIPCQACALTYADTNGNRHVVGLVDVSIHPPGAPQTLAGDVVEITSLGVSVGSTPQGGFLTVGYSRNVTATLRDNALVLGNPVTALENPSQQTWKTDR